MQTDKDLQEWLAINEFAGLLRLKDDSDHVLEDNILLRRVRLLDVGKHYYAMPSRGGIKALRTNVQDLNNYIKTQSTKSEQELEEAIIVHGPGLLGMPFGKAVAVRIVY